MQLKNRTESSQLTKSNIKSLIRKIDLCTIRREVLELYGIKSTREPVYKLLIRCHMALI